MARLTPYFARNSFQRFKPRLSEGFQRLTTELIDLLNADGRARVSEVHARLFPASSTASANAALSRVINTVNQAAKTANVPLEMKITAIKKSGAQNRWVWFEGEPGQAGTPETRELNAIPEKQLVQNQRAMPLGATVVLITFNKYETQAVLEHFCPNESPRIVTRDGITYNDLGLHGGMRVVLQVSAQGQAASQSAAYGAIRGWAPSAVIAVGIAFGIKPARQKIGDVLVSESIRGYELARINPDDTTTPRGYKTAASPCLYQRFDHLNQTRTAAPAMATHWPTVHFGTILSGDKLVDNLGYRASLIQLEQEAIGGEMEAVGLLTAAIRHKVDWLVVKAALDLGNLYADTPEPDDSGGAGTVRNGRLLPADIPSASLALLRDWQEIRETHHIPDTRGTPTTLHKERAENFLADHAPGVEILPYLREWIEQPNAPPLFALLGEYGMGKTVTCQRLVQNLDERRKEDPTLPTPLYFDLRHISGLGHRVPDLRETLEECMKRSWINDGNQSELTLESVYAWIRRGAVVIIDGLDEVLVRLQENDDRIFTGNLLKLLVDQRRTARGARCNQRAGSGSG